VPAPPLTLFPSAVVDPPLTELVKVVFPPLPAPAPGAFVLADSSAAIRFASGTTSISRKSKHDELRNVAWGSLALYGGSGVSKDIV
jgi:hypothetical protein